MSNTSEPVVRAGFIALTDCAPIIVAHELKLDKRFGIQIDPIRLSSWAAMRDHIAFGALDCAHMLGGLTLAMHMGLGGLKTEMTVPLMLGRGGNAITISETLYTEAIELHPNNHLPTRAGSAALLAPVVAKRRAMGLPQLRLAVVHAFSSHNYELRAWLAFGGIDPDLDVDLDVIPPPKMVEALKTGLVDGYCVGEPWSQLAVEQGLGRILATKADLYSNSPEKVLAIRRSWIEGNQKTAQAVIEACTEAMRWTANVDNHTELAQMLARPAYLDTDYHVILNGLNNAPRLEPEGKRHPIASYLSLGGAGNVYPHADSALWLYAQMRRWGQAEQGLEDTVASLIDQSILKTIQKDVEKDEWVEQRSKTTPPPFDGVTFNPKNIEAYWQSFPIGKLIKT